MKKFQKKFFYHFYKTLFGLGLRAYYKKICVSGLDKIPANKPIITTSNHPTGLMDVFLASHHIKRQIKFTAAGALFKDKLQAAFLTSVGTIPVYRRKDSPGEQDKNLESFEHCFQELESGGAIGFYPEGTSHPEPWVNPIKTGAARVALQAEQRNDFKLNLLIIPIGVNSPHPGKFRETVFVNIGDPIAANKYQQAYQQDPIEAVNQLTAEIQQGMEACAFHIRDDAMMNIFEAFKIVGIIEIEINGPKIACEAEKIFNIIKTFQKKDDDKNDKESESSKRFEVISQELNNLKQHVQIQGISGTPFQGTKTVLEFTASLFTLILALPILIPSIVINILPFMLSKNLGKKLAGKDLTLIPAGRLMMGTVIFLLFYLLLFIILAVSIGFLKAIAICAVLLICGYLTFWCWEILKRAVNTFRKLILWGTQRDKVKELIEIRCSLFKKVNEILNSIAQ
jgi:glycerol-3-phosphate O-acyltransferase/dihydroxyacetone phosphate acyltransferase